MQHHANVYWNGEEDNNCNLVCVCVCCAFFVASTGIGVWKDGQGAYYNMNRWPQDMTLYCCAIAMCTYTHTTGQGHGWYNRRTHTLSQNSMLKIVQNKWEEKYCSSAVDDIERVKCNEISVLTEQV